MITSCCLSCWQGPCCLPSAARPAPFSEEPTAGGIALGEEHLEEEEIKEQVHTKLTRRIWSPVGATNAAVGS